MRTSTSRDRWCDCPWIIRLPCICFYIHFKLFKKCIILFNGYKSYHSLIKHVIFIALQALAIEHNFSAPTSCPIKKKSLAPSLDKNLLLIRTQYLITENYNVDVLFWCYSNNVSIFTVGENILQTKNTFFDKS